VKVVTDWAKAVVGVAPNTTAQAMIADTRRRFIERPLTTGFGEIAAIS
jgi:hypothetical protein